MSDIFSQNFSVYVLSALAAVVALTVHEYAHARAAFALGDPTARNTGRLSLNPLRHLDLFGTICLILFRFGWAKPVPIDPRYFKRPKRDFALTALAGPLVNLLLAFLSAFLYLLTFSLLWDVVFPNDTLLQIALNSLLFLRLFHYVNLGLAVFNLLPVPPLDGSRLLNAIFPPKVYFGIMKYERIIYWTLIGWLFIGDFVSDFLLCIPIIAGNPVLAAVAFALSLSNLLGAVIDAASAGIFALWQLIPFLSVSV